uniref:Uncharacterized protein n=1 Tax=Elaeophora elaphi TaxID=1147741 RepID=A0A0R3S337_9BILA
MESVLLQKEEYNAAKTSADKASRVKETASNEILKKKHEDTTQLKQWPNTSRMVKAFADVDRCLGEDDMSIYGNDSSAVDSGIGSRPVSRENTNEAFSEYTEEPRIIHTSLRYSARKWYDRNDPEPIESRSGVYHRSRTLTPTIHDSLVKSSRLPKYRSIRQDLSITRHVVRVRNAHSKRAKSAAVIIRHRKPESRMESYENYSTFYDDFDQFY